MTLTTTAAITPTDPAMSTTTTRQHHCDGRQRRCVVSFDCVVQVHLTLALCDYTDEERSACFVSEDAYVEMREGAKRTVIQARRKAARAKYRKQEPTMPNHHDGSDDSDESGGCLRGLEHLLDTSVLAKKRESRDTVRAAVLTTIHHGGVYSRNGSAGVYSSVDVLAKASKKATFRASRDAAEVGAQDAAIAAKIHSESIHHHRQDPMDIDTALLLKARLQVAMAMGKMKSGGSKNDSLFERSSSVSTFATAASTVTTSSSAYSASAYSSSAYSALIRSSGSVISTTGGNAPGASSSSSSSSSAVPMLASSSSLSWRGGASPPLGNGNGNGNININIVHQEGSSSDLTMALARQRIIIARAMGIMTAEEEEEDPRAPPPAAAATATAAATAATLTTTTTTRPAAASDDAATLLGRLRSLAAAGRHRLQEEEIQHARNNSRRSEEGELVHRHHHGSNSEEKEEEEEGLPPATITAESTFAPPSSSSSSLPVAHRHRRARMMRGSSRAATMLADHFESCRLGGGCHPSMLD